MGLRPWCWNQKSIFKVEAYIIDTIKLAAISQCSLFSYEGLVHHEYAPKSQVINKEYFSSSFEKAAWCFKKRNDHRFGKAVIDCFMHWTSCSSTWQNAVIHSSSLWLLAVSEIENATQRTSIWHDVQTIESNLTIALKGVVKSKNQNCF